jgi:hypothetical protein
MRFGQIVFAAVLLLWAVAEAKAGPPGAALSRAVLQSGIDVEAAGWRHRHRRDYFWTDGRADVAGRDDANPSAIFGVTRPTFDATRPTLPEILRRDTRRRGGRWVDPPPE